MILSVSGMEWRPLFRPRCLTIGSLGAALVHQLLDLWNLRWLDYLVLDIFDGLLSQLLDLSKLLQLKSVEIGILLRTSCNIATRISDASRSSIVIASGTCKQWNC